MVQTKNFPRLVSKGLYVIYNIMITIINNNFYIMRRHSEKKGCDPPSTKISFFLTIAK